jgi:arylformamidase
MGKRIIDLSVTVTSDTVGPPSTNHRVDMERHHRGPGFWQVTSVAQSLHTGTHIDTPLHCYADGGTTDDASLDDFSGPVAFFDLPKGESEPVTRADLEAADPGVGNDHIAVLRTGWSDGHWGQFPDFFVNSPYLEPDAATWLASKHPKAVAFDFFEEYSARLPNFTSEEFVVHRILLGAGVYLIEQTTNLAALKGQDATLYAAFYKLGSAEGAPARVFALV